MTLAILEAITLFGFGLAIIGTIVWIGATVIGKAVGHKKIGTTHSDGTWSPE